VSNLSSLEGAAGVSVRVLVHCCGVNASSQGVEEQAITAVCQGPENQFLESRQSGESSREIKG